MSEGIIKDIHTGRVIVEILCKSSCAECLQKGNCAIHDMTIKTITVDTPDADTYNIGEKVKVELSEKDKKISLFFAYILPLCLLLCSLSLFSVFEYSDTLNAIASLIVLAVYYVFLRSFHNYLKKHIKFDLQRISVD